MWTRKLVATAFVLCLILAVGLAAADEVEEKIQPLVDKINIIIKAAQIIFVTASVGVLMYAGWLHMTSEGQPEKEQRARKAFMGGLIGLAIVVLAEVIKTVVVNLLS